MNARKICIFGGSGFVGRHIASRFSDAGLKLTIASRRAERSRTLSVLRGVRLTSYDPAQADSVAAAIGDCDVVINLVGILNQSRRESFRKVHIEWPTSLVAACHNQGVKRILHMSALNASESHGSSHYLRSKGEAENSMHTQCKPEIMITSFRPSVIFGRDDDFFNRFVNLMRAIPGPFPLACPESRLAPVYVGDVAEAFYRALNDRKTFGEHYDLCGPHSFTLKQLVEFARDQAGIKKNIIALGDGLSRLQARVLSLVPGKPFTMDNYRSLQTDSLCKHNGLIDLGIEPSAIDIIVPGYLSGQNEKNRRTGLRKTVG